MFRLQEGVTVWHCLFRSVERRSEKNCCWRLQTRKTFRNLQPGGLISSSWSFLKLVILKLWDIKFTSHLKILSFSNFYMSWEDFCLLKTLKNCFVYPQEKNCPWRLLGNPSKTFNLKVVSFGKPSTRNLQKPLSWFFRPSSLLAFCIVYFGSIEILKWFFIV